MLESIFGNKIVTANSLKEEDILEQWVATVSHQMIDGKWNGMTGLVDHIRKHANELDYGNKIPEEWIASMRNLLRMCEYANGRTTSPRVQLDRMYLHWLEDPKNMTPPPAEYFVLIMAEGVKNKTLDHADPVKVLPAQKSGTPVSSYHGRSEWDGS